MHSQYDLLQRTYEQNEQSYQEKVNKEEKRI